MRKTQKDQAEEVTRLLAHVHGGIKKAIEAGRWEEAMGLLAQCQESAINLGEMIEETEGEGTAAVPYLEEYCESVYQIYSMLEQGQDISGQKAFKSLRKTLIQAENSIKQDIKIRKEAVFLPYKASMWDSLESVWKAANEDPDCDAYVIPIPYYDRNPDGSFGEEHYEGNLYPENVPVCWYEDYDFAGRRPDMIFIHNPYDECNYVTSVHPFFYSKNLKNFTDKLVYIPYFIIEEIEPGNKEAEEGIVNFCNVPAVFYSDKVVVQSEKMRQVYINVLSRITGNASVGKEYWEAKILGLGSPKVDKVFSTRKENAEAPKEWLKVIEKPDGSWKKIIFYNTGLTALLRHEEKMLVKMRDVFRIFKENQDEVALLWRPHPLIKAAIKSMRPRLREEYERIVAEYKKEGWGIYDDTAEMDRAIALCDAYYGDHSSLVRLCKEAGKPVMIQDVEISG